MNREHPTVIKPWSSKELRKLLKSYYQKLKVKMYCKGKKDKTWKRHLKYYKRNSIAQYLLWIQEKNQGQGLSTATSKFGIKKPIKFCIDNEKKNKTSKACHSILLLINTCHMGKKSRETTNYLDIFIIFVPCPFQNFMYCSEVSSRTSFTKRRQWHCFLWQCTLIWYAHQNLWRYLLNTTCFKPNTFLCYHMASILRYRSTK